MKERYFSWIYPPLKIRLWDHPFYPKAKVSLYPIVSLVSPRAAMIPGLGKSSPVLFGDGPESHYLNSERDALDRLLSAGRLLVDVEVILCRIKVRVCNLGFFWDFSRNSRAKAGRE